MMETIVMAGLSLPPLLVAGWYALLLAAARFARPTPPSPKPRTRFAILIPAHNEALGLPRTLRAIRNLDYPRDLVHPLVVAHNCTDATAAVAAQAGIEVLEHRQEHERSKGFALMHGLSALVPQQPDVILFLDADAELDRQALRVMDACFAHGRQAVQGAIITRNPADAASSFVAAVGNVLDNRTAQGRGRLGLPVRLRGSNMAFSSALLARVPWACHGLTEDAEYADLLRQRGIGVHFEAAAVARSESAASHQALFTQRRRWRAALTGRGMLAWLESKPLLLAHLLLASLIAAGLCASGFANAGWLAPLACAWAITLAMYASAIQAIGWRHALKAAWGIPAVLLNLLAATCRPGSASHWQRTQRVAELAES